MNRPPLGLFLTGTNTGVGKTYVTTIIARELQHCGLRVGLYKPVCSGSEIDAAGREFWPDVERLSAALEHRVPREWICPQSFAAPLAPPSAARIEGREIDRDLLRSGMKCWSDQVDVVLVEGVGGWLCPIADGETVADLAVDFGYPVLVVAALELGAINHTLLTVESVRRRQVPLAGILLNLATAELDEVLVRETTAAIAEFSDCPMLGKIHHGGEVSLIGDDDAGAIDWFAIINGSTGSARSV